MDMSSLSERTLEPRSPSPLSLRPGVTSTALLLPARSQGSLFGRAFHPRSPSPLALTHSAAMAAVGQGGSRALLLSPAAAAPGMQSPLLSFSRNRFHPPVHLAGVSASAASSLSTSSVPSPLSFMLPPADATSRPAQPLPASAPAPPQSPLALAAAPSASSASVLRASDITRDAAVWEEPSVYELLPDAPPPLPKKEHLAHMTNRLCAFLHQPKNAATPPPKVALLNQLNEQLQVAQDRYAAAREMLREQRPANRTTGSASATSASVAGRQTSVGSASGDSGSVTSSTDAERDKYEHAAALAQCPKQLNLEFRVDLKDIAVSGSMRGGRCTPHSSASAAPAD